VLTRKLEPSTDNLKLLLDKFPLKEQKVRIHQPDTSPQPVITLRTWADYRTFLNYNKVEDPGKDYIWIPVFNGEIGDCTCGANHVHFYTKFVGYCKFGQPFTGDYDWKVATWQSQVHKACKQWDDAKDKLIKLQNEGKTIRVSSDTAAVHSCVDYEITRRLDPASVAERTRQIEAYLKVYKSV